MKLIWLNVIIFESVILHDSVHMKNWLLLAGFNIDWHICLIVFSLT